MQMTTLRDLLIHELSDLHSAEKQLTKALPKKAKAANDETLAAAFEAHLAETEGQLERLDQIFEMLGEKPKRKVCKAMQGLVEEGKEAISEDAEPAVYDASLIACAQRVEHYEIAGYGCARTFARLIGEDEVADLLQETLDEEAATDAKLTEIAMAGVNQEAAESA